MTYISNTDYMVQVSRGLVPGATAHDKFGRNLTVAATTEEDVWTPGGLIPYQTSAQAVDVTAGANDVMTTGTGAWEVTLKGLDGSYASVEETISLNGTSIVTTTQTFLRLERMYCGACGSVGTNDGDVDAVWTGGAVVANQVLAGAGQGEYLALTVPANKLMLPVNFTVGLVDDASAGTRSLEIYIKIRLYNATSTNNLASWRRINTLFLNQSGTTQFQKDVAAVGLLPAKTDFRISMYSTKADTNAFGRFEYILYDT